MKDWIRKWLGIENQEERIEKLEDIEVYTLSDICNKLSDSFVILAGDHARLIGCTIPVPKDRKYGILSLGYDQVISNCLIMRMESEAENDCLRPNVTEENET